MGLKVVAFSETGTVAKMTVDIMQGNLTVHYAKASRPSNVSMSIGIWLYGNSVTDETSQVNLRSTPKE